MPVDRETVPGSVECDDVMTAPVHNETVPRSGAQSDATSRAPANRGLAGLSDAGLTFLESDASRRSGAFRSPAKRLSAVVGSQRRPAVQLERSARGATVGALARTRGVGGTANVRTEAVATVNASNLMSSSEARDVPSTSIPVMKNSFEGS